jgi:hypothetical protein
MNKGTVPNGMCNQKHAWNTLRSAVCSDSVRKEEVFIYETALKCDHILL